MVVFGEFIEYAFYFPTEAAIHIINFILCWGITIYNNEITPANP
jgi:hypothetical protein